MKKREIPIGLQTCNTHVDARVARERKRLEKHLGSKIRRRIAQRELQKEVNDVQLE